MNALLSSALSLVALAATLPASADPVRAPSLTTTVRATIAPSRYGNVQLIQDRAGRDVLVSLANANPGEPFEHLSAVDATGNLLGQVALPASTNPKAWRSIRSAALNDRGEIVAITIVGGNESPDLVVESVNLTRGTRVALGQNLLYTQFGGRVSLQGRELVLLTSDLQKETPTSDPGLVQVIDEDTGHVVQKVVTQFGTDGEIGLDSHGRAKALLRGSELFELLDVASGTLTDLLPPHPQASAFPGAVDLSIGRFITLTDETSTRLFDPKALMDGIVRPVRTFSAKVTFVGTAGHSEWSVERVASGLEIRNLATGQLAGPAIPVPASNGPRDVTSVDTVIATPQGLIAVLSAPKVPDSYLTGTILNYVDVRTSRVLRTISVDQVAATAELHLMADGRVLSVEQIGSIQPDPKINIVDVRAGQVLSSEPGALIGTSFLSRSGRLVGIVVSKDMEAQPVCVQDLAQPSAASCVNDPLVSSDVKYGYQPFQTHDGELVLPLLTRAGPYEFNVLGYTRIQVQ